MSPPQIASALNIRISGHLFNFIKIRITKLTLRQYYPKVEYNWLKLAMAKIINSENLHIEMIVITLHADGKALREKLAKKKLNLHRDPIID